MNSYFEQSGFYGSHHHQASAGDQAAAYRSFPLGLGMGPYGAQHALQRAPQDSPYDASVAAACKLYASEPQPPAYKPDCSKDGGQNGYAEKGWSSARPAACTPDGRSAYGAPLDPAGSPTAAAGAARSAASLSSWNNQCSLGGGAQPVPTQLHQQTANHTFYPWMAIADKYSFASVFNISLIELKTLTSSKHSAIPLEMLSIYHACAMALLSASFGSASIPLFEVMNQDNNQMDNTLEANVEPVRPSWVKISQELPATIRHASGSRAELECSASGSPAPIITWLRDSAPIAETGVYESNALVEGSEHGVVKAHSRLILNSFHPTDKVAYTCMATSGSMTAFSTTDVYVYRNDSKSTKLFFNNFREELIAPVQPRVVFFYQTVLENQGTTLVLPCKVVGNPRPKVRWMNSDNIMINNQDPRMKVTRSGELIIRSLRWSDMGPYTCMAMNLFGKDTATSFVYPAAN